MVVRWCRAWAIAAEWLLKFAGPGVNPKFATRLNIVPDCGFFGAALLNRVCAPVPAREGRIAATDGLLPQNARRTRGPICVNGDLFVMSIAIWAAKAAPVRTRGNAVRRATGFLLFATRLQFCVVGQCFVEGKIRQEPTAKFVLQAAKAQ